MRDIRSDLEERISAVQRERDQLETNLTILDQRLVMLKGLLQQENDRLGVGEQTLVFHDAVADQQEGERYSSPVARCVFSTLRRLNPAPLEALKAQAAKDQVPFGGKNPGRVIHFLLLGMEQNGIVERMPNGDWKLIRDIHRAATEAAS